MSEQKRWPIKGYWIRYNPETNDGACWLNMDNDPKPEIERKNLSAQQIAAVTALLTSGGVATYFEDGYIGIQG